MLQRLVETPVNVYEWPDVKIHHNRISVISHKWRSKRLLRGRFCRPRYPNRQLVMKAVLNEMHPRFDEVNTFFSAYEISICGQLIYESTQSVPDDLAACVGVRSSQLGLTIYRCRVAVTLVSLLMLFRYYRNV